MSYTSTLSIQVEQIALTKQIQSSWDTLKAHAKQRETLKPLLGRLDPGKFVPGLEDKSTGKPRGAADQLAKNLGLHVGVIGAGMAGLYTAMILEDLGIPYEILEADDVDEHAERAGRVYTHRFDMTTAGNYYDVGAMRFPDIPIMHRTFDLFLNRLKLQKDRSNEPAQGALIPYHFTGEQTPLYYNNKLSVGPHPTDQDTFNVSQSSGGLIPDA
jgi:hypothetical protein